MQYSGYRAMWQAVVLVTCHGAAATAGVVNYDMGPPFYSGAILPTPREAEYREEYAILADGPGGERACNLRMDYEGASAPLARRLIEERVGDYIRLLADSGAPGTAPPETPVLVTTLASLAAKAWMERHGIDVCQEELGEQGYVLEIRPEGVLCAGLDNAGVVNAVASLLQLVHVRDGKLVARCCSVCDWPAFTTRYTAEYFLPGTDFFDWMMLYKINGFGACYPGMNWEGLTDEKRAGLRGIGQYIRAYETLRFMVQFHVGGRRCRVLDCGDPEQVERLLETIRETMDLSHAHHVMICYDDVQPELQPEEEKQFASPVEAHGALMDHVYAAVKAKNPETVVSFCTPFYQGRGHRRWRIAKAREMGLAYLGGIRDWKNPDVRIVWTGPVTESKRITLEDIESYQEWVGRDRPLVYWDNTWHYHQPLRNFHAQYPKDFLRYCADGTSYINVNGVQPIGRFFSATANDYYWNPDAFDPKRARREAVTQFMGPDAVAAAEAFYELRGDDYFVFFTRDVDLEAFGQVVAQIEETSLRPELPAHCRKMYQVVVERREKVKKK